MDKNQIDKSNLISRDLSWLNFNHRVLDLVKNSNRSILDRLKFLSIVASNFDEFFEVRVGSLYNYIDNKKKRIDYSGMREDPFREYLLNESKKILHDPSLEIIPTCVRVPVKIGHSESLCISTDRDVSIEDINSSLSNYSGIKILDNSTDLPYPMPLYSEGKDEVFVGRIRKSPNNDREINLWLSCDNLLKGAALNALQILESMIKRDLIKIN